MFLNRGSWFAAIRIATGSQRFQIARFEKVRIAARTLQFSFLRYRFRIARFETPKLTTSTRKLRKAVFTNAAFQTRHFWHGFCSVFCWRPISIFMRHLQLRCKVSDTGAPSLPSTTVILTLFKDRAVLRDPSRRYNILVAHQLHPAPESAARINSCETL